MVDARNTADALIYSTEKTIKELGDKIDSETKRKVEDAINNLKKAMEGEDTEEIKRLSEELTQASHKLAEAMYQQASQEGARPDAEGAESKAQAGTSSAQDDDVVDADFEEVKDDKK